MSQGAVGKERQRAKGKSEMDGGAVRTFEEYVVLAEKAHGHICAGQILGLRMALYGVKMLGLEDPTGKDRKRLVTFVEIDRCATDAISVVTGCRLGKRALKFRDFGKVAATFCDLQENRAVRVAALESSKQRAREMYPEIQSKNVQQMRAYRELPDEELFAAQWVRVNLGPEEMPGYKAPRAVCAECGEGINFKREVVRDGNVLCKACAGECYYEPL
jgi:formylmethanofuran dehydrogenase subunit E